MKKKRLTYKWLDWKARKDYSGRTMQFNPFGRSLFYLFPRFYYRHFKPNYRDMYYETYAFDFIWLYGGLLVEWTEEPEEKTVDIQTKEE